MEVKAGYKQSGAGLIPEEWDAEALGSHVEIRSGESPSLFSFKNDGVPYFKVEQLNNNSKYLSDTPYFISGNRKVPRNSLIFPKRGASILLNKIRILKQDAFMDTNTMTLTLKSSLDHEYLYYALTHIELWRIADTTSIPQINNKHIIPLVVPVPPLPEQRAIAGALSEVDELIGALDQLVAKKRDLKQAAMQQLLTGSRRLPGFSGRWEYAQVQDVISGFFCGPSPTCEERNTENEWEWGVLKTTAITKENGWDWTKHKTLPRIFWDKPHLELKLGDVIVTKAGPRHRVGVAAWVDYIPRRIIPSGKMIGLRPRLEKVIPLMLSAAISGREAQEYLDHRATGMAESQVNFENIALLHAPIRIPSIEEQTAIAAVLTDLDAELTALEGRRAKTRALKQGMMQELLTGRIQLPGIS